MVPSQKFGLRLPPRGAHRSHIEYWFPLPSKNKKRGLKLCRLLWSHSLLSAFSPLQVIVSRMDTGSDMSSPGSTPCSSPWASDSSCKMEMMLPIWSGFCEKQRDIKCFVNYKVLPKCYLLHSFLFGPQPLPYQAQVLLLSPSAPPLRQEWIRCTETKINQNYVLPSQKNMH